MCSTRSYIFGLGASFLEDPIQSPSRLSPHRWIPESFQYLEHTRFRCFTCRASKSIYSCIATRGAPSTFQTTDRLPSSSTVLPSPSQPLAAMEPAVQVQRRPPPKTYLEALRRSQEPLPPGARYTTPTDDEWAHILNKRRHRRENPEAYLRASAADLEIKYAYLEMSDRARPSTPFDNLLTDKTYGLLNLFWSMKKAGMESWQLGSAVRQNKMHRDGINVMRDWATDNLKRVVLGPDVHYRDFLFEVLDDLNEISAIAFGGSY